MKRKKFKRAYIHLGTEKTGSTSIQAALDTNRALIERRGLYYPNIFGGNHNAALGAAFDPSAMKRPLFRHIVTKYARDLDEFRSIALERLECDLEATQCDALVVSSEFFATKADLNALKTYFQECAEQVIAVIYLREQSSFLSSLVSTMLKAGGNPDRLVRQIANGEVPKALDYGRVIRACIDAFGISNVTIGIFDRSLFPSSDIVCDFLEKVRIHGLEISHTSTNESLSFEASSFLYIYNSRYPAFNDQGLINPQRKSLKRMVMSMERSCSKLSKRPFLVDRDMATKVMELCRAGNEEVRRLFFPDSSYLFRSIGEQYGDTIAKKEIIEAANCYATMLASANPEWDQVHAKILDLR